MRRINNQDFIETLAELNGLPIKEMLYIGQSIIKVKYEDFGCIRTAYFTCVIECPQDNDAPSPNARIQLARHYNLGLGQKAFGLPVKKMTKRDLIACIGLISEQLAKTCPLYQTLPPEYDDADPLPETQGGAAILEQGRTAENLLRRAARIDDKG